MPSGCERGEGDRRLRQRYVGHRVLRREDARLLTGAGRYVADIRLPGMLHLAVLRSPHAHARILHIDTPAARETAGVVAVLSHTDITPARPIPLFAHDPALRPAMPHPLAREKVRYVGEPVAVVLAESPALAEEALGLIEVAYDPLEAVADPEQALERGAALVHEELGTNEAARLEARAGKDVEAAFQEADLVVRARLRIARQSPQPLEPRGCVATWDLYEGLTVWDSTQSVHMVRRILSDLLGLPEEKVRVRAPDVGGGFGGKNRFYPEEFLTAYLAMRTGRPVRWLADRRDDLLAMYQDRGQVHDAELALAVDGTILGLRDRFFVDQGAYTPLGVVVPQMTLTRLPGAYRVPAYHGVAHVVYTNKVGVAPYRGAGQPPACFVLERLIDLGARRLGLDPAEVRLRNLIQPQEHPWDTGLTWEGSPIVYDGGDYPASLRKALELLNYRQFRSEQAAARDHDRYLGVGMAVAVEMAAMGPVEGARVTVDQEGRVTVFTGAGSQGQGIETTLSQVCADRLGCRLEDVSVVLGDTGGIPYGGGTWASRTAVAAGNAVGVAATRVRRKALDMAAGLLEAGVEDLDVEEGRVFVKGVPQRSFTLGQLARAAAFPNVDARLQWPTSAAPPRDPVPGLEVTEWHQPAFTFGYSALAALVEVDPETCTVRVHKLVTVHDCGRVLNPMVVEGQVYGGVVQGIGGALFEEVVYDERAQNLATTLMDYALARASAIPQILHARLETPAPNPEGVKGMGEGGIIPVAAAICGAIDDALSAWGLFCTETPVSPARLWRLLHRATA